MAASPLHHHSPAFTSDIHPHFNRGELPSLPHAADRELPHKFICPQEEEEEGPDKSQDHLLPQVSQLPVLDMSKFSDSGNLQERKALASDVHDACKEWGSFQVVNHGVPLGVIRKVKEVALGFFALPTEQKEKVSLGRRMGYERRNLDVQTSGPWQESLAIGVHPDDNVAEIAGKVWEKPNHDFVDVIKEYSKCAAEFAHKIWILLAESLGLESNTFSKHLEDYRASFRFNVYPSCPHPSVTFGAGAHTDPNLITILYQDEVGGLEVHHGEGEWIPVQPHEGAFVIFIGDSLQAWTNDLYHSVEHRVLVNPERARISMGFFIGPSRDVAISPLDKWIDEAHPLKYKNFNWGDFEDWIMEVNMKGEKPTFMRSWLSKIVIK